MPNDPPTRTFDLTDRPWLPVLGLDGREAELSLREVFRQAPELRRVVGDIPTQEFALLRLLLSILHDAVDGPQDTAAWGGLWANGLPVDDIDAYLDEHRERFDLLHPDTPFYQVAELNTTKGEISSLDRLVADVPNGTPFFSMRARGVDRLGFAEAARWLVHAHAFDPSGIKSGAVGDSRVKSGKGYPQGVGWAGNLGGVFVEGATVQETLLLNLVALDMDGLRADEQDRPAWLFDAPGAGQIGPVEREFRPYGVRDLYTWQARRVRLHHDADGVHGVLLCYGDPLASQNMHRREPMSGWRRSQAQEKKLGHAVVYMPREHNPARAAWRGLESIVVGHGREEQQHGEAASGLRPRIVAWLNRITGGEHQQLPGDFLIRTRLVGAVYGTQQSVIDEVVDDRLAMPVVLLHGDDHEIGQTALDAVQDAEDAVTALGNLAADLAQAAGADPATPREAARDRGFGALDGPFRAWLVTLTPGSDTEERRAEWHRTAQTELRTIAGELLTAAGEAAWIGRLVATRTGNLWLNSAFADRKFRRQLTKALPKAHSDTAEVSA